MWSILFRFRHVSPQTSITSLLIYTNDKGKVEMEKKVCYNNKETDEILENDIITKQEMKYWKKCNNNKEKDEEKDDLLRVCDNIVQKMKF